MGNKFEPVELPEHCPGCDDWGCYGCFCDEPDCASCREGDAIVAAQPPPVPHVSIVELQNAMRVGGVRMLNRVMACLEAEAVALDETGSVEDAGYVRALMELVRERCDETSDNTFDDKQRNVQSTITPEMVVMSPSPDDLIAVRYPWLCARFESGGFPFNNRVTVGLALLLHDAICDDVRTSNDK